MVSFANTDERWRPNSGSMENFALKKIAKTSIISNYFPLIQWIKKTVSSLPSILLNLL